MEHAAYQQRMSALEKANDVRTAKSVRKRELTDLWLQVGKDKAFEDAAMIVRDPHGVHGRLKAFELLRCLPFVGGTKAQGWCRRCDINPFGELRSVTPGRREALAKILDKLADSYAPVRRAA